MSQVELESKFAEPIRRLPGDAPHNGFFLGALLTTVYLSFHVVLAPDPSPFPVPGLYVVLAAFFVVSSFGNLTYFFFSRLMGRRQYSTYRLFGIGLLAGLTYPPLCYFLYRIGPDIEWASITDPTILATFLVPLVAHSLLFAVLDSLVAVPRRRVNAVAVQS